MNNNCQNCLSGVACNATNCKYHTGSYGCCASAINVGNQTANQKSDTFCSTFVPKNGVC